jgi:hypothetical protein
MPGGHPLIALAPPPTPRRPLIAPAQPAQNDILAEFQKHKNGFTFSTYQPALAPIASHILTSANAKTSPGRQLVIFQRQRC